MITTYAETKPLLKERPAPTVGKYLELTIHRISGRRQQFIQTDPIAIWKFQEQWHPERFFTQKQVMLATQDSVTVIPTDSIERVELRSQPLPEWRHHDNVADIEEITEEAFHQAQMAPREEPLIRPVQHLPEIVLSVEMRSGKTLFLRIRPNRRQNSIAYPHPPLTENDVHSFLAHLFCRSVICGKSSDGQVLFLLNPSQVEQFTITPAPPKSVAGALLMQSQPAS